MIFFRTIAVWGIGFILTTAAFLTMLLSSIFDRKGNFIHSIASFWSRLIIMLAGTKIEVRGAENVPRDRPVIFVSNHQGAFDIPALQGVIPIQFRWLAKKSLFSVPLIGWSMSLAGYIPIERENSVAAYKSMEEAAERIKNGTSVVIFPEGTRSQTGELLPFKRGAFMLASKSGVDMVPVAIRGTREILKKGGFWIKPSKVEISFCKPVPVGGADEKTLRNIAKREIVNALPKQGLTA